MKIGNKQIKKSLMACENVLVEGNVNNWLISSERNECIYLALTSCSLEVPLVVRLLRFFKKIKARLPGLTKKAELYSY